MILGLIFVRKGKKMKYGHHAVTFSKGLWMTPMTGTPFTATQTMVVTYWDRCYDL
jgi:hypothetical protein